MYREGSAAWAAARFENGSGVKALGFDSSSFRSAGTARPRRVGRTVIAAPCYGAAHESACPGSSPGLSAQHRVHRGAQYTCIAMIVNTTAPGRVMRGLALLTDFAASRNRALLAVSAITVHTVWASPTASL